MDNNKNSINIIGKNGKKIYLYNEEIEKNIEKKHRIKLIIKTITLTITVIACFMYMYFNFDNSNSLGIISFILGSILIFPTIYYFMITFLELFSNPSILGERCYAIVDDKFLSLKFSNEFFLYNRYKKNNLMSLVDFGILTYNVKLENERVKDIMINSDKIKIDDLISYIEVINVYHIKEFYNRYEVKCDYIEKIEENNCTNSIITIYKYCDNYQEIYKYLCDLKNKPKKEIKAVKKNKKLLKFFLKNYDKQKDIYIIPIFLIVYYLYNGLEDIFYAFLILVFIFLGYSIITWKILKLAEKDTDKIKIKKVLKSDIVTMIILFILSIISIFIK